MYEEAYIYESVWVLFYYWHRSLFVMNLFCFHSVFQDKNFYLQKQEFVVGSDGLEKTFESIESS